MRNPLNKRLPRELKSEIGKYIVLFIFLAGMISIVSGFIVAASSMSKAVACQAKRKKVTRKTQKTALIYPIYGNQSGFSYVI